MAYQIFFSRVPARMSMYRKCDSFDIFAKSEAVTKEYIAANILKLCEYKPTEDEMDFILSDTLPPVYSSFFTKDGSELVQARVSFVSSDYTGERPSYLFHFLVMNDEERRAVSSRPDGLLFNPDAFTATLSDFDMTSRSIRPIPDYPELDYPASGVTDLAGWADKYDEAVLRKIIYSILNVAASNQKYAYISLGKSFDKLSTAALDFFNHIMLVFPYSVRRNMSFISEFCDNIQTKQYKLRFIPSRMVEYFNMRGYVIDTERKVSFGVYEDDMKQVRSETDFLISLFSDEETRLAFLAYYERICTVKPEYDNFNMRVFSDLVLLFRQIYGKLNDDNTVFDDNFVLNLLTTYEKYRDILTVEDRQRIWTVFAVYTQKRLAIPQNIFARIGKIYPTEPAECKKVMMGYVLELLHTNIMRDKLFAFIASTYESESAESRDIICEDLSRVFYGGFLQSEIIDFYSKHFSGETPATQTIIVDKLLMTIRTEAIQKKILSFIEKYSDVFSPELKRSIYHTFLENLPENDALSKRIVPVFGKCLESDTDEVRNAVFGNINYLIETDESGALLDICLTGVRNGLPIGNHILRRAFTEWCGDAKLETVLSNLLGNSLASLYGALSLVWTVVPDMTDTAYGLFYDKTARTVPAVTARNDLFDILEFDRKMRELVSSAGTGTAKGAEFYGRLYQSVLLEIIGSKLPDAFNVTRNKAGLGPVLEFVNSDCYLSGLAGAAAIRQATEIISSVTDGNPERGFEIMAAMSIHPETAKLLAATLRKEFKQLDDAIDGAIYRDAVLGSMYSCLENGRILLSPVFNRCLEKKRSFDRYNKPVKSGQSAKEIQAEDSDTMLYTFGNIVRLCVTVNSMDVSEEFRGTLFASADSEFDKLARRVFASVHKNSVNLFREIYDYARHGSLLLARKIEIAVIGTPECPKAFKRIVK